MRENYNKGSWAEAFLALDFFGTFCIKCFIPQGGGKKNIKDNSATKRRSPNEIGEWHPIFFKPHS